jgi:alkanesulfonate monooxygenase SsuD/methylene tetrahydromethanopterin reductase-like flavin-dependent oxidoreductase (luciferase family)
VRRVAAHRGRPLAGLGGPLEELHVRREQLLRQAAALGRERLSHQVQRVLIAEHVQRIARSAVAWQAGGGQMSAFCLYFGAPNGKNREECRERSFCMQFGVTLPNMGVCSEPRMLAELAREAEAAGWDAVFVWDALYVRSDDPRNRTMCDPWIALAAIAMATERVTIGPIITPLARRRPWKLARETVSLDHLSNGRLVLPVGLGAIDDGGFSKVGEEIDRKLRAKRLDEGLAILAGLWSGRPFSFAGEQYQVEEMTFLPPPIQSPRIPIWVVAAWPRKTSMRRALRWDGVMPVKMNTDGSMEEMTPAEVGEMRRFIDGQRGAGTPYEVVIEAEAPGDASQAGATLRDYAEAGVTWWLEPVWKLFYAFPGEIEPLRERIRQGPPGLRAGVGRSGRD